MVRHTTVVQRMKRGAPKGQREDLHGEIQLNCNGQVRHGSNGLDHGVMERPNELGRNEMEHGVMGQPNELARNELERGGVVHGGVVHGGLVHGLQRLQRLERHGQEGHGVALVRIQNSN